MIHPVRALARVALSAIILLVTVPIFMAASSLAALNPGFIIIAVFAAAAIVGVPFYVCIVDPVVAAIRRRRSGLEERRSK